MFGVCVGGTALEAGMNNNGLERRGDASMGHHCFSGLACMFRRCVNVLTSIPACRETHRAEKYEGYFDFKQLKICAYIDFYRNFT